MCVYTCDIRKKNGNEFILPSTARERDVTASLFQIRKKHEWVEKKQ